MQTFDGFLFLSADGIPYNSMNSRLSNSAVYMGMNGASFQGGNLIKDHCSSVSFNSSFMSFESVNDDDKMAKYILVMRSNTS